MWPSCSLKSLDFAADVDDNAGPYALQHFLPAGALSLALKVDVHACRYHGSGWHLYAGLGETMGLVKAEDESLMRMLDFLVVHQFIAVTCRVEGWSYSSVLHLRVYLIPYDLANVEGKLRRRDEATVLNPARNYLRQLLLKLSRDPETWNAESYVPDPVIVFPFFDDGADNRTLAEIYNTLPSPRIQENGSSNPHPLAQRILAGRKVHGLKSTLYQYQRQTIAAMIERELQPGSRPDPLYVPIYGINQEIFYMQPATMEILRDRPSVYQNRGGILCEELGTGKTVMILGLVLATLDQLPTPEESILDPRPVLTPLSLRHFPSVTYEDARAKFGQGPRRRLLPKPENPRVPPLTELLLDFCRLNPAATQTRKNRSVLKARNMWKAYKANAPFYHHYEEEPFEDARTSRKPKDGKGPRTMYLSAATLVLVPPNLMNQWANEMNKHCKSGLRRYIATEEKLPPARQLASYDVVLISHSRLSQEASRMDSKNIQKLHSWRVCPCSQGDGWPVRVPRCQCEPQDVVSPLLQIRWKRLAHDEGQNSSNTNTKLVGLLNDMSFERKWIVTGTPTTNLMGLRFGSGSELQYPDDEEFSRLQDPQLLEEYQDHALQASGDDNSDADDVVPPGSPIRGAYNTASGIHTPVSEEDDSPMRAVRVWTYEDRGDLNKLGAMVSSFLGVPQFAVDPKLFGSHVIAPLMCPSGPRPGSIQVLTQVMESVMIRHRIEDVEQEVLLPLLTQETVLVDLDPLAVTTYNVLQSLIAINAITSEREGQDYFFHARSSTALKQLVENISQAMFWHTDEASFSIDETLAASTRFITITKERVEAGRLTEDDLELLYEALDHIESAYKDPIWRALSVHPYVFSRVSNMPQPIYQAWSYLPPEIGQVTDPHTLAPYVYLNPDRLIHLRQTVTHRPLAPVPHLIEVGQIHCEAERHRVELLNSTKKQGWQAKGSANAAVKAESALKLVSALTRLEETVKGKDGDGANTSSAPSLLRYSPLAGVRIGNSTSSKLNYILNEVKQFSSTSKFLIFSRSPLTLVYIAEGLALMNVQYKITTKNARAVKILQQDVMTFESSDRYRVFLMELKHGARGLNLVTASRVIFCEPVWQADVETQAIKRVHRIGQTSPVSVKTLAVRSTAEEMMVARRDALRQGASSGRLPNLTDDDIMRAFIQNPQFLPPPPPPALVLDYALLPEPPEDGDGAAVDAAVESAERKEGDAEAGPPSTLSPRKRPRVTLVVPEEGAACQAGYVGAPPPKRRKAVQFAAGVASD